ADPAVRRAAAPVVRPAVIAGVVFVRVPVVLAPGPVVAAGPAIPVAKTGEAPRAVSLGLPRVLLTVLAHGRLRGGERGGQQQGRPHSRAHSKPDHGFLLRRTTCLPQRGERRSRRAICLSRTRGELVPRPVGAGLVRRSSPDNCYSYAPMGEKPMRKG